MRREREGLLYQHVQLLLVVAEAAAQATEGVGGADNDGITQLAGGAAGVLGVLHGLALDGLHVNLVQLLHEQLAVLGVDDGLHGSTQYLHVVLLEHACLIEGDAAVQGRLSAKGQHNAVGALLRDDFLHEIGRHGEEIDLVGHALRGLHGGDIGVDEDGGDAFLLQCLQGLRTGVVKFARFAYLQCTAAQEQHFLYIGWFHMQLYFNNYLLSTKGFPR